MDAIPAGSQPTETLTSDGIQIKTEDEEDYSEYLAFFDRPCGYDYIPPACVYIKGEEVCAGATMVETLEKEGDITETRNEEMNSNDIKDIVQFPENFMEPIIQVDTDDLKQELDEDVVLAIENAVASTACCPVCGLQLPNNAALSEHKLSHQSQRRRSCALCGQLFSSSLLLMRHLNTTHTIDMPSSGLPSSTIEEISPPIKKARGADVRQPTTGIASKQSSSSKRAFQCSQCNKTFCNRYRFEVHEKMHKEKKLFPCMYCPKCFTRENTLKTHLLKHNDEKPFSCILCGNQFRNKHNLSVHLRLHTGELPYECKVCGKRFRIQCTLTVHMVEHAGEKPYKCAVCKKGFKTKRCLKVHMRSTHTRERPYVCHHCGKRFAWCGELNKHIKIDHLRTMPARPYRCRNCFKKFRLKPDYEMHISNCQKIAVPQEALLFDCHQCGEKFHRKIALRYHMEEVHDKFSAFKSIGKFECEPCGRRFMQKTALRIHIRKHLEPNAEAETECPYCKLKLCSKAALERHARTHTGERPYNCPKCNKKFPRNGDVVKHLLTHIDAKNEKCKYCGKDFRWRTALYRHIRVVHTVDRPHECSICGRRFAWGGELTRHMSLHTGGKPYVCHFCPKKFPRKRNLTKHLLQHTGEVPDDD